MSHTFRQSHLDARQFKERARTETLNHKHLGAAATQPSFAHRANSTGRLARSVFWDEKADHESAFIKNYGKSLRHSC